MLGLGAYAQDCIRDVSVMASHDGRYWTGCEQVFAGVRSEGDGTAERKRAVA